MKQTQLMATSALTAAIFTALAGMAQAQTAPAAQPVQGAGVEEVIVTAQRRAENLQDVPLAVSAFSADTLAKMHITQTRDILTGVPNLTGGNSSGLGTATNYQLRGLSNTESLATFEGPVGTYIDDIYVSRFGATNFALFDVERIEVLRGPQGTLFGRNTTGGAVSIHLKKPTPDFGGSLVAEVGNYQHYLVSGSVNIPVGDKVRTKFAGFYTDEDGYVTNRTTGGTNNANQSDGFRAAASVDFTPKVTWDVSADYMHESQAYISFSLIDGKAVSLSGLQRLGSRVFGDKGNIDGNTNEVESKSLTSDLAFDTPVGKLDFITGYRDLDQQFNLDFFNSPNVAGGFLFTQHSTHKQFTQEVKLSGEAMGDRLRYTTGLYYFKERNVTDFSDVFNGAVLSDRTLRNQVTSYAAYAQADFDLTETLTFTAGLRYTDEKKTLLLDANPNPLTAGKFFTADLVRLGIPTELKTNLATPRFVLTWEPSDDFMVYASATNGFKSGGWNGRSTAAASVLAFNPEKIWSYELGTRLKTLENKLQFNATAFYAETKDLQIPTGSRTAAGAIAFLTGNFSDLHTYGAEFETIYVPVPRLNIRASLGLLEAKYENLKPAVLTQQALCQSQLAARITASSCAQGIIAPNGAIARPARAPHVTASLGFDYSWQVGEAFTLQPSANLHYVSKNTVSPSGVPQGENPPFLEVSAGLTLQPLDKPFSFDISCQNCTDEHHVLSAVSSIRFLSPPRRLFARVRYNF